MRKPQPKPCAICGEPPMLWHNHAWHMWCHRCTLPGVDVVVATTRRAAVLAWNRAQAEAKRG